MIDALLRCYRSNIHRYRRLLTTELTDLERGFIERRLDEEQSKLDALAASASPLILPECPSAEVIVA
ncbi:hypothetical protein [Tardiphaga sp. P9-11]|uniref:hypothetical protein n=1 Tax=Tardiphaga sp. P9-11 TaxID=2024614 RepID=UPI0011F16328|nr:hypothetical protein [Tardiphaga sp. P9-11]KAA0069954.1 hypothetical protein CIW50_28330 [Tardiphaga sp. P9-11]